MEIAVSLIICTRNRAPQLQACLASVAQIRCDLPWEAIIVDNGSSDDTPSIIAEFFAAQRGHHVVEPTRGVCRAKNAGIAASSGKILAFTDDDCYPAHDWLTFIFEAFTDPRIGFIGGRVLLHDPDDARLTINESMEPVSFPAGGIVPCAVIHGCNMAFRRSALTAVGGFDVSLGPGTPYPGEDWEAVARVCSAGWAGGYSPTPLVYHHHRRAPDEAAGLLRGYHYGGGATFVRLVQNPATRWPYVRHWVRRTIGDLKSRHFTKLWDQSRGAYAYWRGARAQPRPVAVLDVDRAV